MATVANIKSALSFSTNVFGITDKTIGTAEIARLKAWFEADYASELSGAEATADDFSAWMWRQLASKVKGYESKLLHDAIADSDEFSESL
jgi:hypothetical protein